jgi:type IV secretion system protein VirD4
VAMPDYLTMLTGLGAWVQSHPYHMLGAAVAAIGVVGGAASLTRSHQARNATTHGSARWARYAEVKHSGLSTTHGVVVGVLHGQTFYDDGPTHVFLMGPTRSAKGICHIQPTLRTWQHSALILDPKDGENYALTHAAREQFGAVEVFAPYGAPRTCINVVDAVRWGTLHEVGDVETIAESATAPHKLGTHMGASSETAQHFRDLASWIMQAGLLHLGYAPLPGMARFHPSLPCLLAFLTQYHTNLAACLKLMRTTRHVAGGVHPAVAQLVTMITNIASDKEMSGLWTTALRPLKVYLNPLVARSTSTSTVALTDLQLGPRPLSLYLLSPSPRALSRLYPVYRVIIDMAMARLMSRPVTTPAHRLLFCAEELPAHGYMRSIDAGAGDMAGYGIKGFYIVQDLEQFEEVYGEKNTIWGNTDTKIFHAPNNERTAERLSRYLLGDATVAHPVASRQDGFIGGGSVSHQHVARRLATADEIMGFDPGKVMVRRTGGLQGSKPMLLDKLGWDPRKREGL